MKEYKSKTFISIIISTYNQNQLLKKCLESVYQQTSNNFELIIVDDNSKQITKEIIIDFMKRNKIVDVKFVRLKKNKGLTNSRNVGLERASGKYVHFLDGDDYLEPDFVSTLTEYNNKMPYHKIIVFGYNRINENLKSFAYFDLYSFPQLLIESDNFMSGILKNNYWVWTSNIIYERLFVLSKNIKFEMYFLGTDLNFSWKSIMSANYVATLDSSLVNYVNNKNSVTRKDTFQKIDAFYARYNLILKAKSSLSKENYNLYILRLIDIYISLFMELKQKKRLSHFTFKKLMYDYYPNIKDELKFLYRSANYKSNIKLWVKHNLFRVFSLIYYRIYILVFLKKEE